MTTLLHISASPRGEHSESLALATTFLDTYHQWHPRPHEIREWDLWDGSLPAFGPDAAAAKMDVFAGIEPRGRGSRPGGATGRSSGASPPTLPVQRPDVERQRALQAQAAHRRGEPARHGLRLRSRRRLHRTADRTESAWSTRRRSTAPGGGQRSGRLPGAVLPRLAAPGRGWRRRGRVSSGRTSPPRTSTRCGRSPATRPASWRRSSDRARTVPSTVSRESACAAGWLACGSRWGPWCARGELNPHALSGTRT